MLRFLPGPVKGCLSLVLICLNTGFFCIPLYAAALARALLPSTYQPAFTRFSMATAENWISINNGILDLFQKLNITVEGEPELSQDNWYLVICNHQSWTDILILQRILNRKIPFLKFFIKQELIYTPIIGLCWWVLDFPIMKRYSRKKLRKHPHLKGKDLATTLKSAEKFKLTPVSVLNFLEGTRFTEEKKTTQKSPYRHLLKPKSGGAAMVINSLQDHLDSILDITIAYKNLTPTFFEFLCGHEPEIFFRIDQIGLPSEAHSSTLSSAKATQHWIADRWNSKDNLLVELLEH
ncbi:MAG: acyltransferase [Gammaproteobacteria bacterium]|nr:acyltransferase [Gammaproteobacteria bacterium]MBT5204670.1 acyltransferase [Gammaproteobacteria bacterium]MBT5603594.1 acyltransferase [Gammaproteobacteria bacterium]MBT6245865.1 acyltransferase [Gammaproteobacteria bacterium]